MYATHLADTAHTFPDLRTLLARASPDRAGDRLAGLAAENQQARVAARIALADVPLTRFLAEPLIDPDTDEVSRLILDQHDASAFARVASLSVGEFRDFLLSDEADPQTLAALAPGVTPEMAAAVSKLMRNQDLIARRQQGRRSSPASATRSACPGGSPSRLQPNHPTDDLAGIGAAILDGLLYGCGDAVIGINPATDNVEPVRRSSSHAATISSAASTSRRNPACSRM